MTTNLPPSAAALHRSSLVIDAHADTPQRLLDDDYDLTSPLSGGHFNLETARQGHLSAEFFAIWADPRRFPGQAAQRTRELFNAVHAQLAKHPRSLTLACSPVEIELASRERKLAILLGIEGGHSIENSLDLLREYHRLGARYMTLTWANSNGWADSSGDIDAPGIPHTSNGLSPFGEQVIREMNRLGMMIDISHVADATFYRTVAVSQAPVFASHSSARALTSAPRNLTDDMLRIIASAGGVIMVNFYSAFISNTWRAAWNEQLPRMEAAHQAQIAQWQAEGVPVTYDRITALDREWAARIPRPPLSDLIDHIEHIIGIAGIEHVGLGSDFDGIPSLPEGIDSAADLPKITAELMRRGHSDEDCRKVLGVNFLRYFRDVQARAEIPHAAPSPDKAGF